MFTYLTIIYLVLTLSGLKSQKFDFLESFKSDANTTSPHSKLMRALLRVPDALWMTNIFREGYIRVGDPWEKDTNRTLVDQCSKDLDYTLASILKAKWAQEMLDAAGKLDSGILKGRFVWPGNYEECIAVRAPPGRISKGFSGRYCWLTISPKIGKGNTTVSLGLRSSICVPNSCQESNIRSHYDRLMTLIQKIPLLNKLNESIQLTGIQCISDSYEWSKSAITYSVFLCILMALVIVASVYEVFLNYKLRNKDRHELCVSVAESFQDESYHQCAEGKNLVDTPPSSGQRGKIGGFLLCFSAIKNSLSIMDISPRKGQLDCLHGIRFLSMAWVILGHTYLGGLGQISNILTMVESVDDFAFQPIIQGTFSVDTFFLLSGFLVAYLFLKDGIKPMGVWEWVYFYVHRYIRLTPTLALVIGMWTSVWLYVGSGPFWMPEGSPDQVNCQKNWWQNLLYINNWPKSTTTCMAWSWYLANDMQFYVISPLFLVPLQRWPIVGGIMTLGTLVASWVATAVISYRNNLSTLSLHGSDLGALAAEMGTNYFDEIYDKPYTRIGPYLVGVLCAFAFLKIRDGRRPLNKWVLALGWVCGSVLSFLPVYGLYHASLDVLPTAFYYAFSRSAFTMGVGWVILTCLTGHGGLVNWILTWKAWVPLSRLTYSAYLIHILVTTWYFGSLKDTYHFSHPTTVVIYLAVLTISYGAAFLTSLFLEAPFIGLEKYVRTGGQKQ